jgi:hypothetical protein
MPTRKSAKKEECEDNDDNNCNERTHEIKQDNDCKAKNEYEKIGSMGSTTNNNQFICTNILTSQLTAMTMNSEIL